SDSPTLPVGYLVAAATALAAPGDRIVLGPSTDGGYYLIGLKRPHAPLFEDIAWSTDQVSHQTRVRAKALELPILQLPTWYEGDDAEALQVPDRRQGIAGGRQRSDTGDLDARLLINAGQDVRSAGSPQCHAHHGPARMTQMWRALPVRGTHVWLPAWAPR